MASSADHTVAFDNLGDSKQSEHLISGSPYVWPDSVPTSVEDRNIAFAKTVSLNYGQVQADATYTAEIVLSSDQEQRQVSISVDREEVNKDITIPPNSEKTVVVNIPKAATADGQFELSIIAGAKSTNAAVSSVRILSSSSTRLTACLPDFGLDTIQYTPIPINSGPDTIWSHSLNGTWKFLPKLPTEFPNTNLNHAWSDIEVPGQWYNQGHDIPKEQATAYLHQFKVPKAWKNRLIKLRFDAVFSDCEVYINGKSAGQHTGGFTPFELDITEATVQGLNTLALRVTSWSLADQMASASKYACHNLGGISRDVTLFSVPQVHLKDLFIRTDFDDQFQNATLGLDLDMSGSGKASLHLVDQDAKTIHKQAYSLQAGSNTLNIPVQQPEHWTPETPNLYTLKVTVDGATSSHPVGFREITTTKTQILVNGKPVTIRGINRHEAHPLRGRSLPKGLWEKDVFLFRDANVNLIRTCHYPPALHLGTASDQLGMWLEIEGPFCWENGPNNPSHRDLTVRQLAEMVKAWRNHPSVLYWSIANESSWGQNFIMASKVMRELDPTRPQTFNWMSQRLNIADEAQCELGNIHYPGFNGKPTAEKYTKRPLLFGEYAHLNAYNRRELITDPGLRDQWGYPLAEMWETMWNTSNITGGAIWSGIDDTFFIGDNLTLGYGAWGPLDPWRRPKPEYWHMKKVYSPVHVINRHHPKVTKNTLSIQIENRGDFLNFNQLEFNWQHGSQGGSLKPNIAPRDSGVITVTPPLGIRKGTPITLNVNHPLGYMIDRYVFPTTPKKEATTSVTHAAGKPIKSTTTSENITVTQEDASYTINRKTGSLSAKYGNHPVIQSGPFLLMTPLNNEGNTQMKGETKVFAPFHEIGSDGQSGTPTLQSTDTGVTIRVPMTYKEAEGAYTYTFRPGKQVSLSYDFTLKTNINPRQTGISFNLPSAFNELAWQRHGQWTYYPEDHIGRLNGTAKRHNAQAIDSIEIGPRQRPITSWSQDNNALGSNDFRSTKHHIRLARLSSSAASLRVVADQDGTHIQAMALENSTKASILGYSNAGCERFLRRLTGKNDQHLKAGKRLTGTIQFSVERNKP